MNPTYKITFAERKIDLYHKIEKISHAETKAKKALLEVYESQLQLVTYLENLELCRIQRHH